MRNNTVYQLSIYGATFNGFLNGIMDINSLKVYGDFGIGGIEGLVGEIIIFNGKIFYINEYSKVELVINEILISKMTITTFYLDYSFEIKSLVEYDEFKNLVYNKIYKKNNIYAVKVYGSFDTIKVMGFPKIADDHDIIIRAKNKKIYKFNNIKGTLVGYIIPDYICNIIGTNIHFHFISENYEVGGHVVDFKLSNAIIEINFKDKLNILLPKNKLYYGLDLSESENLLKDVVKIINK